MRYVIRPLCLLLVAFTTFVPLAAEELEVLGSATVPTESDWDTDLLVPVNFFCGGCTDCGHCCEYPAWYASGDALFLHRGRPRNSVLAVADRGTLLDLTDDIPLLNASELRFNDYETGFRAELGRAVGHGLFLEGTYFQVSEWDTAAQVTTNGIISQNPIAEGISPPLSFFGTFYNADSFFEAVQQSVLYQSDLRSAELNFKATWQFHQFTISEYVGVRYLQVREMFALTSQDELTSTVDNGIATYRIDTDNDLIGGQYGAEFLLPLFGRLLITTRLKAGVYLNAAEQETQIIDSAILRLATKDTDDEVAVVGEINVGVNFKVNHILSVRGGYNFLWVDGLALAAEQGYPVGLTGVAPINDNGGLFYHGFNVGVQVSR